MQHSTNPRDTARGGFTKYDASGKKVWETDNSAERYWLPKGRYPVAMSIGRIFREVALCEVCSPLGVIACAVPPSISSFPCPDPDGGRWITVRFDSTVVWVGRDVLRRRDECETCGTAAPPGETLLLCSRCKACTYCNVACQRVAWATHQRTCCTPAAKLYKLCCSKHALPLTEELLDCYLRSMRHYNDTAATRPDPTTLRETVYAVFEEIGEGSRHAVYAEGDGLPFQCVTGEQRNAEIRAANRVKFGLPERVWRTEGEARVFLRAHEAEIAHRL
jgi:hypothetical protein